MGKRKRIDSRVGVCGGGRGRGGKQRQLPGTQGGPRPGLLGSTLARRGCHRARRCALHGRARPARRGRRGGGVAAPPSPRLASRNVATTTAQLPTAHHSPPRGRRRRRPSDGVRPERGRRSLRCCRGRRRPSPPPSMPAAHRRPRRERRPRPRRRQRHCWGCGRDRRRRWGGGRGGVVGGGGGDRREPSTQARLPDSAAPRARSSPLSRSRCGRELHHIPGDRRFPSASASPPLPPPLSHSSACGSDARVPPLALDSSPSTPHLATALKERLRRQCAYGHRFSPVHLCEGIKSKGGIVVSSRRT